MKTPIKLTIQKENFLFYIQKDLTEPCPECGVPACGKEDFFWYEKDGKRITLVLDGSLLNLIILDYFKVIFEKSNYASLPKFLRESNECIGWSEAEDFVGTELDIDDLLAALDLIKTAEPEEWLKEVMIEYVHELNSICKQAKSLNNALFVARN